MSVGFHEGGNSGMMQVGMDRFEERGARHIITHTMEMMLACMSVIWGGVCERHPKLRIAFLESGGGWIAGWLDRMDRHFDDKGFNDSGLKTRPSELFQRNCWIAFEPVEHCLKALVDYVGPNKILWATDYPHPGRLLPRRAGDGAQADRGRAGGDGQPGDGWRREGDSTGCTDGLMGFADAQPILRSRRRSRIRGFVGWVERSETHRPRRSRRRCGSGACISGCCSTGACAAPAGSSQEPSERRTWYSNSTFIRSIMSLRHVVQPPRQIIEVAGVACRTRWPAQRRHAWSACCRCRVRQRGCRTRCPSGASAKHPG